MLSRSGGRTSWKFDRPPSALPGVPLDNWPLRLVEDAKAGRMSEPVPFEDFDTDRVLLHPRFANVRLREDAGR